jgi:hypothetical protein
MNPAGSRACRGRTPRAGLFVQSQDRQSSLPPARASQQPKGPGIHVPSHSPATQTPLTSRTNPLLGANLRTLLLFAYLNSSGIKSDRSDDCQTARTSRARLGPVHRTTDAARKSVHSLCRGAFFLVVYRYRSERSTLVSIHAPKEALAWIWRRSLFARYYRGIWGARQPLTRLPSQSG